MRRRFPARPPKKGRAIMRGSCSGFILALTLALSLFLAGAASPEDTGKPSPKDKCPVCGMFVAKYPDWIAQVTFRDGSRVFFDGAKDLFKFYFNVSKYRPGKKAEDVESIRVTDYYDLTLVDGLHSFYVVGSNVFGPMGKELIPFHREEDAREFLFDHFGKSVLRFKEVTPELIKGLD
jgi:nitrous oxide reductase accessory protein NosL